MNKKYPRFLRRLFLIGLILIMPLSAFTCENGKPIRFAGLDWDSNAFITEITRTILEKGYKCKTEVIPGSTIPLLTGMQKNDIDIMMEVWMHNIKEAWSKGEQAGKIINIGVTFRGAKQGFFIPRYMVEGDPSRNIKAIAPELKAVEDLPQYKQLFRDKETPDKGRLHNCIYGWGCEIVNSNKIKAYGLDKHYTNFRSGTAAALSAAIASAHKRGKPFVGYYWEPTWIMGTYDMILLEEPAYNEKAWNTLVRQDSPRPVGVAYPLVDVYTGVNAQFAKKSPQIIQFLQKMELTPKLINEFLAQMKKTDSSHQVTAQNFLRQYPKLWESWVPAPIAKRVQRSLPHI